MMKTSDPTDIVPDSSYFQRLSLCSTLQRIFTVYQKGFVELNKLMLAVGGSYAILWAACLLVLPAGLGVDTSNRDAEYMNDHIGAYFILIILLWLLALLFGVIGHAAIVRITADLYLQRPTQCTRSYLQAAARLFGANLAASILTLLGITVGLLLFILPGIYLITMWSLSHAAITIEGLGATSGLKRSWSLVSGRWCYTFGTKFAIVFPYMVFIHYWIKFVAPSIFTFWGFIVTVIPGFIISPLLSVLVTVLYINLRVEKEGLDAQALANDIGESISREESEMTETNNETLAEDPQDQVPSIV